MDAIRGANVLGIGLTTFLATAVVVTEAASATTEFSVFLGIPAGIVGAGAAMALATRVLGGSPSRGTVAVAAAIAADGYAVLAGFALRYAVPATRDVLTTGVIGGLSLLVGLAVGVAAWVSRP
jgi:hypothetical protein